MARWLIAITCTPESVRAEVQPEEVKVRFQQHLCDVGLLQPGCTLDQVLPYLHRIVVAPYPLTLSIADAFLPSPKKSTSTTL